MVLVLSYRQCQLLLFGVVVALLLVGTWRFSEPQTVEHQIASQEVSTGACEGCHEDFVPLEIRVDREQLLPTGQLLKVRADNKGQHEVQGLMARITGLAGGDQPPQAGDRDASVSVMGTDEYPLLVEVNASHLRVELDGDEGLLGRNDIDLTLDGPRGDQWTSDGDGADEALSLSAGELKDEGPGEYTLRVEWVSGEGAVDYHLSWEVSYTPVELLRAGPDLSPGDGHLFTWPLNLSREQVEDIGVEVRLTAHHAHDGEGVDSESYSVSYHQGNTADEAGRRLRLGLGQALGLSMALLVAAGVLSGFYASSRLTRPFWIGEARRRHRLDGHTLTGLLLLGLVIPHALVLQSGPFAGTTLGAYTGLATLMVLAGLTVLTLKRKPLIAAWGWPRWQQVHRWTIISFLLLLLYHVARVSSHLRP